MLTRYLEEHRFAALVALCPPGLGQRDALRAARADPSRVAVLGSPAGRWPHELADSLQAQLTDGLDGMALDADLVVAHPKLMDMVGLARRLMLVRSKGPLGPVAARALLGYLDRHPGAAVLLGDWAGVSTPDRLACGTPEAELVRCRQVRVVCAGPGPADSALGTWGRALLERAGWERLVWGTAGEAPDTSWARILKVLHPGEDEREGLGAGHALSLLRAVLPAPRGFREPPAVV